MACRKAPYYGRVCCVLELIVFFSEERQKQADVSIAVSTATKLSHASTIPGQWYLGEE
jgi:hypothetical protein